MLLKEIHNSPGNVVGPGFCDQTLAVKSRKNAQKSAFVKKSKIGPGGLRAPHEVAFAMHSWPLLLPTFGRFFSFFLFFLRLLLKICYILA